MLTKDNTLVSRALGLYGTVGLDDATDYRTRFEKLLSDRGQNNLALYDSRFTGDSWTEEAWKQQEELKTELPYILFYSGFCGTNPTVNLPVETLLEAFISDEAQNQVVTFWNSAGYEKRDLKIFERAKRLVKEYNMFIEVIDESENLRSVCESGDGIFVHGGEEKAKSLGIADFRLTNEPAKYLPNIFAIEKPEKSFQKLSGYSLLELFMYISTYPSRTIGVIETAGFESCPEATRILKKIRESLKATFPDSHIFATLEEAAGFISSPDSLIELKDN